MELVLTILATMVVLVLGMLAAMPIVRRSQSKATIELLRSELQVETEAREAQDRRHKDEVASLRLKCEREVAELRGRLDVVTEAFAETIAAKVLEYLQREGFDEHR